MKTIPNDKAKSEQVKGKSSNNKTRKKANINGPQIPKKISSAYSNAPGKQIINSTEKNHNNGSRKQFHFTSVQLLLQISSSTSNTGHQSHNEESKEYTKNQFFSITTNYFVMLNSLR